MYLSRVELDTSLRNTKRAMVHLEMMHAAIERSSEEGRNLWRIDKLNGKYYLLVLSQELPDLGILQEQFGRPDCPGESKDYTKFVGQIKEGQRWRFRLKANPVHAVKDSREGRGKTIAHVSEKWQREWLMKRAEKNGFSLEEDSFEITDVQWFRFGKNGAAPRSNKQISIKAVTFEGVLTVSNEELFKGALIGGIGREKAYGCGMMTLMRA